MSAELNSSVEEFTGFESLVELGGVAATAVKSKPSRSILYVECCFLESLLGCRVLTGDRVINEALSAEAEPLEVLLGLGSVSLTDEFAWLSAVGQSEFVALSLS